MSRLWRHIILWSVSLILAVNALPVIAGALEYVFQLPHLLIDLLAAFLVGIALGKVQTTIVRPVMLDPYWTSHTAIASVCGAFVLGAMSIFAQSASSLAVTVDLPLAYVLVSVAVFQSYALPVHFPYRGMWLLTHCVLAFSAATQFWIGVILASLGVASLLRPLLASYPKQKRTAHPQACEDNQQTVQPVLFQESSV